jgi:hypothetical protein
MYRFTEFKLAQVYFGEVLLIMTWLQGKIKAILQKVISLTQSVLLQRSMRK